MLTVLKSSVQVAAPPFGHAHAPQDARHATTLAKGGAVNVVPTCRFAWRRKITAIGVVP